MNCRRCTYLGAYYKPNVSIPYAVQPVLNRVPGGSGGRAA